MSPKFRRYLCLSSLAMPFACSIPDERQTQTEGESQGGHAGSLILSSIPRTASGGNGSQTSSAAQGGMSGGMGVMVTGGLSSLPGENGGAPLAGGNGGGSPVTGGTNFVDGSSAAGKLVSPEAAGRAGSDGTPGGGSATTAGTTTGGAPVAGPRDCTSTSDANLNQVPDRDEPECACKTPNEVRVCTAASGVGVCKQGAQSCVFAADKTSSSWSTCIPSNPRGRDCFSSDDNNCNGTSDSAEGPCEPCGKAPQACETHPGYDGIGECHAGSQSVTVAADRSECNWTPCAGSQGPTGGEKCGLSADGRLLDTNCNGKPGDGEYNTTTCLRKDNPNSLYVFREQYNTTNFVPLLQCKVTVTAAGPHSTTASNTCYYYAFEKCSVGLKMSATFGYAFREGGSLAVPSTYKQLAVPNDKATCTATISGVTSNTNYPQSPTYADGCSNCTATDLYVLPPPP